MLMEVEYDIPQTPELKETVLHASALREHETIAGAAAPAVRRLHVGNEETKGGHEEKEEHVNEAAQKKKAPAIPAKRVHPTLENEDESSLAPPVETEGVPSRTALHEGGILVFCS